MDIGNLQEELYIKCNKKIYLQFEGRQIDVLDADGNLNVKLKNIINTGTPTYSSPDGFYYDGTNVYAKIGSKILNLNEDSSESLLPKGSIIMYHGNSAPSGWSVYNRSTGFNDAIYITNDSEATPSLGNVTLYWKLNGDTISRLETVIGETNTFPTLDIVKDGNFPVQVSYSSTNQSVAYVDSGSGSVILGDAGTAIIRAIVEANSYHGAASAQYYLTATKPQENVYIDWRGSVSSGGTLSITEGDSFNIPTVRINNTSLSQEEFKTRYITYRSTNTSVAVVGKDSYGDLTIQILNPGTTQIYAECTETEDHIADYAEFTLQVAEREKITVTISVSNQSTTDDQSSYTPTIGVTGASLSELVLQIGSDPNNIVSRISGNTILLTGNSGTANISAIIQENDTHKGASKTFRLTVEETAVAFEPYTVGLLSDVHYCLMRGQQPIVTWDNANDSNTNASSLYDKDLKYLLNGPFRDADFVASAGDLAEWDINDFIKFTSDFKSAAPNKKFYSCMGNHDHQVTYGTNRWTKYNSNHEEIGSPDGSRWYGVDGYNCPGSLSGQNEPSYYIQKGDDMYIFLSVNYGSENSNHDGAQWAHPQNQLNQNDSNVQQMISLCGINSFIGNESNFNFQYYSPSDLIWLYNLIRNNQDKRKFIFVHHFFPNKAGGGNKFESGQSSILMGITFHFLNWLNDQYPQKAIWFSGHSHISWRDTSLNGEIHWCNKDYDYIKPTASDNYAIAQESNYSNNKYKSNSDVYNRNGNTIRQNGTAWTVHLPSMSRPCTIPYNGAEPIRNVNDCEAAIMRVYEDRVEIEKLAYTTSDNGNTYTTAYTIPDKTLTVYNDGTGTSSGEGGNTGDGDYVSFTITNNTSQTAWLSNKFKFTSNNITVVRPSNYENEIPLHFGAGPWTTNTIKLEPGQSKTLTVYDPLKDYDNDGTFVSTNNIDDFVGSTIDGIKTYTYCNEGLRTNLILLQVDNVSFGDAFQKNITYNLSVERIDYDIYTGYADYYNPTPDTPTPTPSGDYGATDDIWTYFNITNTNGDYTLNSHIRLEFNNGTVLHSYRPGSSETNSAYAGKFNKYPRGGSSSWVFDNPILSISTVKEKYRYLILTNSIGAGCTVPLQYNNGTSWGDGNIYYKGGQNSCIDVSEAKEIVNNYQTAFSYFGTPIKSSVRVYFYDQDKNERYYEGTITKVHTCASAGNTPYGTSDLGLYYRNGVGSSVSSDQPGVMYDISVNYNQSYSAENYLSN